MPFSPSDISGLKIWLKADAGAGTTDGDAVATWTDQSGGSHNFTQATAGKRPTYRTGKRNGLPAVVFDGVNDELDGGDLSALFTSGASVFAAVNGTDGLAQLQVYDHASIDDWWVFSGGKGYWGPFRSARLADTPSSGLPGSGWHQWSLTADNGANYKMWLDGVSKINDSAGFTFQGGTSHNIGHQRTNNNFPAMELGELIVYDSALGSTDRASVETYLGRWGDIVGTAFPGVTAGVGAVPAPTATGQTNATPTSVAGIGAVPAPTAGVLVVTTPSQVAGVGAVPAPTAVGGTSGLALPARVVGLGAVPTPTVIGGSSGTSSPLAVAGTGRVPHPHAVGQGTGGGGGSINGVTDYWAIKALG